MSAIEKGCEAIGGGCFWAEFWASYHPIVAFLEHDAFRNGAIAIAAIVTLLLAIRRLNIADEDKKTSIKQAETSAAGLNIDRFQKGAAMLADNQLSVRQAGILMLSELAQQNMEKHFPSVQQVLCSFARDVSELQNEAESTGLARLHDLPVYNESSPPEITTVLEELTKLCEMRIEYAGLKDIPLNLSRANFTETVWNSIKLNKVDFERAVFTSSLWINCSIENCIFIQSGLSTSYWSNTKLTNSKINSSSITGTTITNCDMTNCIIKTVNFFSTDFENSKLKGCDFKDSIFHYSGFYPDSEVPEGVDYINQQLQENQDCKGLTYAQLSEALNVDPELLLKLKAKEDTKIDINNTPPPPIIP